MKLSRAALLFGGLILGCSRSGLDDLDGLDGFGGGAATGGGGFGGGVGGHTGGNGGTFGGFGGGGVGGIGGIGAGGSGGGIPGDCCQPSQSAGCNDPGITQCVCSTDVFCCDTAWDSICVTEVTSLGCGSCGTGGSGGVGGSTGGAGGIGAFGGAGGSIGGSGGIGAFGGAGGSIGGSGGIGAFGGAGGSTGGVGGVGATGGIGGFGGFGGSGGSGGAPPTNDCCDVASTPGCKDPKVMACVCQNDPFCCNVSWDSICVNEVEGENCGDCGAGVCGDGNVDVGESCDLGPGNQNRPAFQVEGNFGSLPVRPVDTNQTAQVFYNYTSASSHTGFEGVFQSRLMLHRNLLTGVTSVVMHHGIDQNSSGQFQPSTAVSFDIVGLPTSTFTSVVDDTISEFNKSSGTAAFGLWQFQANSDGGALTGLPVPGNWVITFTASFSSGITNWSYIDGQGSLIFLSPGQQGQATLRAFNTPSQCRTDCTIPKCGDNILDGGEVCDDGNTVGGDGCSANCKALN